MVCLRNNKKTVAIKAAIKPRRMTHNLESAMKWIAFLAEQNKILQREIDLLKQSKVDKLRSNIPIKKEDNWLLETYPVITFLK